MKIFSYLLHFSLFVFIEYSSILFFVVFILFNLYPQIFKFLTSYFKYLSVFSLNIVVLHSKINYYM